jgi:NitT/TauT family transport system substrate-binding protein
MGMMDVVYWTGHGDNLNFFGMNSGYKGQRGEDLYTKMSKNFVLTGDAEQEAPAWRSVIFTGAVQAAEDNLKGAQYDSEAGKTFTPPTAEAKAAPAIATKPVSISFATGKFQLDANAKTIIDLQFADVAKSFANARIRIEGNTDNVGGKAMNMDLSKKRAQAVADYLTSEYQIDKNRFIIIGNGPDKPVPGCEDNKTEECKALNRRTDFQLISD